MANEEKGENKEAQSVLDLLSSSGLLCSTTIAGGRDKKMQC